MVPQMMIRKGLSSLYQVSPALSGLLVGLSFPVCDWHALAWVALIPIAWSWGQPAPARWASWSAYVGGVLSYLLGLSWLRTSYASGGEWFGPNADAWLVLSLVYGATWVPLFWYGRWFARIRNMPSTLVLPVVWTTCEMLRFDASMVLDQVGFPWCYLGATQADDRILIQFADLGGEHGLSFLIAMVNGAMIDGTRFLWPRTAQRQYRLLASSAVAGLVLLAVVGYGRWRLTQQAFEPGPVVCLMTEMDLPPYLNSQRIEQAEIPEPISRSWAETSSKRPDLLLWPEKALHHKLIQTTFGSHRSTRNDVPDDVKMVAGSHLDKYQAYVQTMLEQTAIALDTTMVIGCERLVCSADSWKRFNSVICVDPLRGLRGRYDKRHLVPGWEFMPHFEEFVDESRQQYYRRGSRAGVFQVGARSSGSVFRCSIALCYDLCFTSHFRSIEECDGRPVPIDFFLDCGAEGQDPTGVLPTVMLRAARLRAIETRRSIVRNVSHGTSGIIDGNGETWVAATEPVLSRPCLVGAVPIDRRTSWYAFWGNWPLLIFCVACGMTAGFGRCDHPGDRIASGLVSVRHPCRCLCGR